MKRVSFLLLLLISSGCTESLVAPKIDSSPPAVFQELWNEFNVRYATFPERHVNWDSLLALYSPHVTTNIPDSILLFFCDSLLSPLRDAHVSITDPGLRQYTYEHDDSTYQFNFDDVSLFYLGETANESSDGYIRYGIIHDSIGYMNVITFEVNDLDQWGNEIDSALSYLQDTKYLIMDVRANEGGKASAGETLEARFMPQGTIVNYTQTRYDGIYTDLSSPSPTIEVYAHTPLWEKPITVLTDRLTTSCGEWFTIAMRSLSNVTVIGDTTQGAFSSRLDRELSNGWQYSMSFEKISDVNHVCHEGIGLIPDIEIYVKENQRVDSPDTVLDRAIEFLTK
jgi:carboxyl-terminal processing protease